MKQNYNSPFFVLDALLPDSSDPKDFVIPAFKKQFPTYREAELFALAGGTVWYHTLEDEYSANTYLKGEIKSFGRSPGGYIVIAIAGYDTFIPYESISGGNGEGGGGHS